jgi:hypothetical protein
VPDALEAEDNMGRMSCTMEEIFGEQQHEQTLTVEAEDNIDLLAAPIDWLQSLLADNYEEEAELQKGCNYNAAPVDLQAPPLKGHSQFSSFAAVNNI